MNQSKRREYSSITQAQYNRFSRNYLNRIYLSLRGQVSGFVAMLNERGIDGARRSLDRYLLNDRIGEVIRDLYVEAGLFFARKTYREIQKSIRTEKAASFGFNEEWTEAIIQYFRQHLLDKAVIPITEETKNQILAVLEKATTEGWSISKIASELQSPELLLWRARMIARTEMGKAAFEGRKVGEDSSEYETQKEWIAANDHRTRHSHRLIDGEIIDSEGRFQVARSKGGFDMMEGPGDPEASAENVINCRCSLATIVKRDENGRPLRKRKIAVIQPGNFISNRKIITI